MQVYRRLPLWRRMRDSFTVVAVVSAPPSAQLGLQVRMREIPRALATFAAPAMPAQLGHLHLAEGQLVRLDAELVRERVDRVHALGDRGADRSGEEQRRQHGEQRRQEEASMRHGVAM
jgi:hypothetical protein